jgi:excinuclease ABC subunit A
VGDTTIPEICKLSIGHALTFFQDVRFSGQRAKIAEKVLKEIGDRQKLLGSNMGIHYLSLSRLSETLSGGGRRWSGVRLCVLDKPSIGLHQHDNERLLETLIHLCNLGKYSERSRARRRRHLRC